MLVITRKVNQSFMVGEANVTVLQVKRPGQQAYVKIGIEAPREVVVVRDDCKSTIRKDKL